MKCLKRNKVPFYYANIIGSQEVMNEDGYKTGETKLVYDTPRKLEANISVATGKVVLQLFGGNESYDKIIVSDDTDFPINEYSALWIDSVPLFDDSTKEIITPNNYVVKKIARSLNSVSVAVSRVNTS